MEGGSLPLVVGPHSLCSTELMGLLLHGVARGNVALMMVAMAKRLLGDKEAMWDFCREMKLSRAFHWPMN